MIFCLSKDQCQDFTVNEQVLIKEIRLLKECMDLYDVERLIFYFSDYNNNLP